MVQVLLFRPEVRRAQKVLGIPGDLVVLVHLVALPLLVDLNHGKQSIYFSSFISRKRDRDFLGSKQGKILIEMRMRNFLKEVKIHIHVSYQFFKFMILKYL